MKPMTEKHKQQLQETLGYKPPAFQLYPDDWLGSTAIQMMLPEQEGAYIRLLAICWGSPRLAIPNNQTQLAVMSRLNSRWEELGPLVLSNFESHPIDGDQWLTNVKLIEVRYRTMVRADAGAEGGKETQAKRKQTRKQTGKQNQTLPSFLPSGVPNSQTSSLTCSDGQKSEVSDRTPAGVQPASSRSPQTRPDQTRQDKNLSAPASPDAGKRPLNAQAQAVKDCLDAYVAGRLAIGQPYPGTPPVGRVVQWFGTQPERDGAVKLFVEAVRIAVEAHKLDSQYHPFSTTIPKFVGDIPKFNQAWLEGAHVNAAKRRGETYEPKAATSPTAAQCEAVGIERNRIAEQTDCAAEFRFGQRGREECGQKARCRGCPQLHTENPGAERYRPASRFERKDGGLRPAGTERTKT